MVMTPFGLYAGGKSGSFPEPGIRLVKGKAWNDHLRNPDLIRDKRTDEREADKLSGKTEKNYDDREKNPSRSDYRRSCHRDIESDGRSRADRRDVYRCGHIKARSI